MSCSRKGSPFFYIIMTGVFILWASLYFVTPVTPFLLLKMVTLDVIMIEGYKIMTGAQYYLKNNIRVSLFYGSHLTCDTCNNIKTSLSFPNKLATILLALFSMSCFFFFFFFFACSTFSCQAPAPSLYLIFSPVLFIDSSEQNTFKP